MDLSVRALVLAERRLQNGEDIGWRAVGPTRQINRAFLRLDCSIAMTQPVLRLCQRSPVPDPAGRVGRVGRGGGAFGSSHAVSLAGRCLQILAGSLVSAARQVLLIRNRAPNYSPIARIIRGVQRLAEVRGL